MAPNLLITLETTIHRAMQEKKYLAVANITSVII